MNKLLANNRFKPAVTVGVQVCKPNSPIGCHSTELRHKAHKAQDYIPHDHIPLRVFTLELTASDSLPHGRERDGERSGDSKEGFEYQTSGCGAVQSICSGNCVATIQWKQSVTYNAAQSWVTRALKKRKTDAPHTGRWGR